MPNEQVTINDKQWREYLRKTGKTLKDIFPVLRMAVNTIGQKDINEHFMKSQGPFGKWEKLKVRKGKPLLDTGNLRNSLLPAQRAGRSGALMINNADYANIHNKGKGNVPQREFMWLSKNALNGIMKALLEKL